MSAHDTTTCIDCGSDALNPKHSGESGVYWCRCESCGHEDSYLLPEEADEPTFATEDEARDYADEHHADDEVTLAYVADPTGGPGHWIIEASG